MPLSPPFSLWGAINTFWAWYWRLQAAECLTRSWDERPGDHSFRALYVSVGIVKPIKKKLSFTFLPSQAPGGNQEIDKTQIGFLQRVSGFPFKIQSVNDSE